MTESTSAVDVVERLRNALEVALDDGRMHYVVQVFHHDIEQVLAALATAEQRAEEDRQKANHLWARYQTLEKAYYNCLRRVDTAEQERDEAREALKPFATYAQAHPDWQDWYRVAWGDDAGLVTMGDCRRAARTLKSEAGKDSGERP